MIPSYNIGLTSFDCDFSVIMNESGGGNMVDEFMREVVDIRENKELWYQPIKFYIQTGELGMLHAEQVIVYVYSGIPFILSSIVSIDGSDDQNASMHTDGEQFMGQLFYRNNHSVYSLGFLKQNRQILSFATDYLKKNALMPTATIDEQSVISTVMASDLKSYGVIYKPGGHRYDVYSVDENVSRAIRPMKDYRFNPVEELGVPSGMHEVLLVGGFPEVVPLGSLCSRNGDMFNVWVPNDTTEYTRAAHIFNSEWLPNDIFDIDIDEMSEAYAMLAAYANETDASNNLETDEMEEDENDTSPPTAVVTVD